MLRLFLRLLSSIILRLRVRLILKDAVLARGECMETMAAMGIVFWKEGKRERETGRHREIEKESERETTKERHSFSNIEMVCGRYKKLLFNIWPNLAPDMNF